MNNFKIGDFVKAKLGTIYFGGKIIMINKITNFNNKNVLDDKNITDKFEYTIELPNSFQPTVLNIRTSELIDK